MPKSNDKLSVDELLRRACIYAERDQQEYAAAIAHTDSPEGKAEVEAFLRQLRAYRKKRWGKTRLEVAIESAEPVPITEVIKRSRASRTFGKPSG